MRDLGALNAADFEAVLGSDFEVADLGQPPLRLHLTEVVRLEEWPGHRRPFLVHFQGPASPVLAPAVHHIVHPDMGELDYAIGPVLPAGAATTYEAIFS